MAANTVVLYRALVFCTAAIRAVLLVAGCNSSRNKIIVGQNQYIDDAVQPPACVATIYSCAKWIYVRTL